jgi:hypothetical protein
MPATARREEGRGSGLVVHLAFELGATEWKLGFTAWQEQSRARAHHEPGP